MPIVICPHCGVNNRTGSNFCNNCGTDLRDAEVERAEVERAEVERTGAEPTKGTNTTKDPPTSEPSERIAGKPQALDKTQASRQKAQEQPDEVVPAGLDSSEIDPTKESLPPEHVDEGSTKSDDDPADALTYATPVIIKESVDDSPKDSPTSRRLGSGIPGLLEPQTIIGEPIERVSRPQMGSSAVDDADLRRIRTLMTSEPNPDVGRGQVDDTALPSLNIRWAFALLAIALAFPIFLGLSGPTGAAVELPGVATAFNTIDRSDKPIVLLLWEYDPATAAELDQVVEPVLRHLEDREYQVVLASTLPMGPATARRMLRKVGNELRNFTSSASIDLGYLPGGAAILPLLGQERGMVLPADARSQTALLTSQLDLVIVAAAQAEAVQQWLEQGQPLNQTSTIAVTSAAADPYLRPYYDSGQLSGIVSGFDGGIAYQRLYNRAISAGSSDNSSGSTSAASLAVSEVPSVAQFRQQVYQNWGHIAILLLILLGNFALLNNREAKQNPGTKTSAQGHSDV